MAPCSRFQKCRVQLSRPGWPPSASCSRLLGLTLSLFEPRVPRTKSPMQMTPPRLDRPLIATIPLSHLLI